MATNPESTLPDDNGESFTINRALGVAEQPARLTNAAYANLINNINLSQQNAVSNQQAMYSLELAVVGKCVELIINNNPSGETATQQLEASRQVLEMLSQTGEASPNDQPTPAPTAAVPPASDPTEANSQSPTSSNDRLPGHVIEAIADSTAISVSEQPAILANLALANQIANENLAQQNAIANQQAMFCLQMATVAKCVEVIANIDPSGPNAAQRLALMQQLLEMMKRMQATNAAQVA